VHACYDNMSAALKTGGDARAMRNIKFPKEFDQKVEISKVNLPVIKKWVLDETVKILGNDDDVVTEMIFGILESGKNPNIKQLQYDLSGFLDKDAPSFCLELWKLCLSAQATPNGIPKELLEAKKYELIQERLAEDRAREEAMKRQAEEREKEREMEQIRERERSYRGKGGRGGRGRGRDRSFDRRSRSRSPPRRRDFPRTDSYVPRGRGRRDDPPPRRRRSPSYGRSSSGSRSPPRRRRRNSSSERPSRSPPPRRNIEEQSEMAAGRKDHKKPRATGRLTSRSPSPRRRRRSSSYSDDPRSPPPRKRTRRPSPSVSRSPPRRRRDDSSSSRSPPPKRRSRLGSDDLMSRKDPKKDRLSRENSSGDYDGGRMDHQ